MSCEFTSTDSVAMFVWLLTVLVSLQLVSANADVPVDANAMPSTSDVVFGGGSFNIFIEGDLSGSVILRAQEDPYRIESDVRIMTTGQLTVEPGVRMEFGQNKSIIISGHGQLIAVGTQDAPIVMTVAETNNEWKGLEIPSGSASTLRHVIINHTMEGLIVRSLNTTLHNVTVDNSLSNGFHIAIDDGPKGDNPMTSDKREAENHVIEYHGLTAINNQGSGIFLSDFYASSVTLVLDGCTAIGNSDHGVHVRADTTVDFRECDISSNQMGGMYVRQINGTTAVRSSKFEHNNGTPVYISDTGGFNLDSSSIRSDVEDVDIWMIHFSTSLKSKGEKKLSFCNNEFVVTSLNGILIHLDYPKTVHVDICDNVFKGGRRAVRVQTSSYYTGITGLNITGNDVINITRSELYDSGFAIFSFEGNFPGSNLTVNNNTFKDNESPACFAITGANEDNNFVVHVENNDFAMNKPFTAFIDIDSYPTMVLRYNRFSDAGNQCYLKAPAMLESSYHLTATHNYWGTSSVHDLVERVCGFDRNMSRSRVEYIPFFLDAALTNLTQTPDEFHVLQAGVTYNISTMLVTGGEVSGEVTLAKSGEDGLYVISRSIWVRQGAVLTIEQGVTLEFESGREIYIDGDLEVEGLKEPVTFKNRTSFPWYGAVVSSKSNTSASANITKTIENIIVENTEFGIHVDAQIDEFTINNTKIRNVQNNCLTVTPLAKGKIFLSDMLIQDCSKTGIDVIHSHDDVIVSNVIIERASIGVNVAVNAETMSLKYLYIINVETTAVAITLIPGDASTKITVEECAITEAEKGIDFTFIRNQTFDEINIDKNTFKNITQQALNISTSGTHFEWRYRSIAVMDNNFINVCSIILTSRADIYEQIDFESNDIINNLNGSQCKGSVDDAFLNVTKHGIGGRISLNFNVFRRIEKAYVVSLQRSYEDLYSTSGSLFFNKFVGCKATGAIVLVGTNYFRIQSNYFFDSHDSPYDIFVNGYGDAEVEATENWFGGKDVNESSKRVYDKSRDTSLLPVTIDPVTIDWPLYCFLNMDCKASRGSCVGSGSCVCHPGWSGRSCETFHCRDVHRCYGNGECVGPNECECSEGWAGEMCNMPYTGPQIVDVADEDRSWVVIVIVVVLGLLLVGVIACVYMYYRRRRRNTANIASISKEPVNMSSFK